MGQQGILSVEHMCHGVQLVGPEFDFRRHAHKADVAPVILAGADAVEQVVVPPHQCLPPMGVFENPLLERLIQRLLLLLGKHGLFLIQDALFLAVLIESIVDFDVPLIQIGLKNRVGRDAVRSVGHAGELVFILTLALDIPLAAERGVHQIDLVPSQLPGRLIEFKHELPIILQIHPGRAHADADFRSGQIRGLHLFHLLRVDGKERVLFRSGAGNRQFLPDVAGQILPGGLPALIPVVPAGFQVKGTGCRVLEDDAFQFLHNPGYLFGTAHKGGHVAQIDTGFLSDGHRQGLRRCVHAGNRRIALDGPLGKNVRFPFQFPVFVDNFQGAEQGIGGVLFKGALVGGSAERPVFRGIAVIQAVQVSPVPV